MSRENKMGYEEIRSRMKKEVKPHRDGAAPKNQYSVNRLNAFVEAARKNFGSKAASELHKEMTSRRR